jgi:hypothetical protein
MMKAFKWFDDVCLASHIPIVDLRQGFILTSITVPGQQVEKACPPLWLVRMFDGDYSRSETLKIERGKNHQLRAFGIDR